MTYEPQHPEHEIPYRRWKWSPPDPDTIQITVARDGEVHTIKLPLGDAWERADGPTSLESACMGVVRELCREIAAKSR